VPLLVDPEHPEHLKQLEAWMKSYKAEELFDKNGRLIPELAELALRATDGWAPIRTPMVGSAARPAHAGLPRPRGDGGVARRCRGQDTLVLGTFLRDVAKLNEGQRNFRLFGPDETLSNLLGAVFEATNRQWDAREVKNDEFLAPAGRVLDSMLSEHQCEGWLEGYLLTGRHGLSIAMRRSFASWIRCSASTPSG